MNIDVVERQRALVALAARLNEIAPGGVVQVYAGFQAPQADDQIEGELNGAIIGVANLGDRWGFGQFDQDPITFELVRDVYLASGDDRWTTLEIKVDHDREFTISLGYDPLPEGHDLDPRVLDRLQGYNASFVAEHGPAPHG